MPSSVVIDPYNDEAVPAIWPCGSIASDVKLANISPNANIISAASAMKSSSGRVYIFTASSMIPATATKPTSQRKVMPEPVDFGEHLLRREHEGEQRPLHAAGRQRIT